MFWSSAKINGNNFTRQLNIMKAHIYIYIYMSFPEEIRNNLRISMEFPQSFYISLSKQILVMKIWSYKASCITRIESMHLKCHVPEITFAAMNDSRQVFQSSRVTDTLAVVSLKKSSVLSWYHVHFIRAILGASQFISQQHNLEHSQQKGVFKLSTCFHALLKS